jgi:hypothetical protein
MITKSINYRPTKKSRTDVRDLIVLTSINYNVLFLPIATR